MSANQGKPRTPPRGRKLVFPTERSFGRLLRRRAGRGTLWGPWHGLGEAQGTAWVPSRARVGLYVYPNQAADLSPLDVLRPQDLTLLWIGKGAVPDSEWPRIGRLTGLLGLYLHESNVRDETLSFVRHLTSLRTLRLEETAVSDAGLEHFSNAPGLTELNLSTTKVRGPGLGWSKEHLTLEELGLSDTDVDDEGIAHLPPLPALSILRLSGARIGDEGLRHVAALPALTTLYLRGTQVGDRGIQYLLTMPSLDYVDVTDTNVTEAGRSAFSSAYPDGAIEPWHGQDIARGVLAKVETKRGRLYAELLGVLFEHDLAGVNYESNADEYAPELDIIWPDLLSLHASEQLADLLRDCFQRMFGKSYDNVEAFAALADEMWEVLAQAGAIGRLL